MDGEVVEGGALLPDGGNDLQRGHRLVALEQAGENVDAALEQKILDNRRRLRNFAIAAEQRKFFGPSLRVDRFRFRLRVEIFERLVERAGNVIGAAQLVSL